MWTHVPTIQGDRLLCQITMLVCTGDRQVPGVRPWPVSSVRTQSLAPEAIRTTCCLPADTQRGRIGSDQLEDWLAKESQSDGPGRKFQAEAAAMLGDLWVKIPTDTALFGVRNFAYQSTGFVSQNLRRKLVMLFNGTVELEHPVCKHTVNY